MDYQSLFQLIPKRPQQWSIQQISKWLEFIHLPQLISPFQQAGIDGSCIHCLDEDTLKNQLNITSVIIRKKLINWITVGLESFDKYIPTNIYAKDIKDEKDILMVPLKKSVTTCARNQSKLKMSSHSQISSFNQIHNDSNSQSYMIFEQFEGNGVGYNIIKKQILSIGQGKYNNITSLQTSISEKHALIGYKNGGYFIQDLGSQYGTFIKINHRTMLRYGMILEIGSHQFMVVGLECSLKRLRLKQIYFSPDDESQDENRKNLGNMMEIQGNKMRRREKKNKINMNNSKSYQKYQEISLQIDLSSKSKYTFGRRKQNDYQKEDKHMSGMHCKITFFNGNFYIEDYGSTNGTWIRISPEFTISTQISLQNDSIIKLGTTISYICRIKADKKKEIVNKSENDGEMVDESVCRICKKSENDCLFLPCSHNICCMQCSLELDDNCPECSHQIGEKIKIHK